MLVIISSFVHAAVCLRQVQQADMWRLHVWLLFSNNELHSWRMRLKVWRIYTAACLQGKP